MNKYILIVFLFLMTIPFCKAEILQDDIADEILNQICEIKTHTEYNYENFEKIPVRLKVVKEILSEKEVYEGQEIKFRVVKDVYGENITYIKRGDIVSAKVKVVITSGMNGIPASIILGDFSVEVLEKGQFSNAYEIFGQDRTLWVYPLKWALTILPPTGMVTNLIMGGHAKLKANKEIVIYYHPEWI